MLDDPSLLVVDDEEAICEGCQRIFSRHGFQVHKTNSAREGLDLANGRDYSAILLDIKMPEMDGIEFLEQLRVRKPSVPVILMTGFPSVPNAVSAVRLGAAGYVMKPFTPEEITQAVSRFVDAPGGGSNGNAAAADQAEKWTKIDTIRFWGESWFKEGGLGGVVRVGAVLPGFQKDRPASVRLPGIGQVVFQGLPMAAVTTTNDSTRLVPAPLSGIVQEVNSSLADNPAALLDDPCGSGWIAEVGPTRFDEENPECVEHRLLLVNSDEVSAARQAAALESLGCRVRTAADWDGVAPVLDAAKTGVVVMDAASLGQIGPTLARKIVAHDPSVRIIVAASPEGSREMAYRCQRIFYYAADPFNDGEIGEVLDAAFRHPATCDDTGTSRRVPSAPLRSIQIVNRNGTKVRLLAAAGLLERDQGLGASIRHRLLDKLFPLESRLGDAKADAATVAKELAECDRLIVLVAQDIDQLPGGLRRDSRPDLMSIAGEEPGRVSTLVVQPADGRSDLDKLPAPTLEALARLIADEMASC